MANELAIRNGTELAETMELGQILARSGFFQDSRDAAQAVVKVLAGRELGFGPIASMTGVYIVKGKVSLSANLMAAAVKRSGRYNYRVKTLTDKTCTIAFVENGEVIGESTFTEQNAKDASLLSNATWKNYPRNMLFARAMSNGVRWYCPDILGGPIYTPDELGAEVDGETGEIIEAPDRVVQPEQPTVDEEFESIPAASDKPATNGNGHDDKAAKEARTKAIAWALGQNEGAYNHPKHAEGAYDKLVRAHPDDSIKMIKAMFAQITEAHKLANLLEDTTLPDDLYEYTLDGMKDLVAELKHLIHDVEPESQPA